MLEKNLVDFLSRMHLEIRRLVESEEDEGRCKYYLNEEDWSDFIGCFPALLEKAQTNESVAQTLYKDMAARHRELNRQNQRSSTSPAHTEVRGLLFDGLVKMQEAGFQAEVGNRWPSLYVTWYGHVGSDARYNIGP